MANLLTPQPFQSPAPTLTATLEAIMQKRRMQQQEQELARRQRMEAEQIANTQQRLALQEKRDNARFQMDSFDRNAKVRKDAIDMARKGITMPFQEFSPTGEPITVTPSVRSFQGMKYEDYTAGTDADPTLEKDFNEGAVNKRELVFSKGDGKDEVVNLSAMDEYENAQKLEQIKRIEQQLNDPSVNPVVKNVLATKVAELRGSVSPEGLGKVASSALYGANASDQKYGQQKDLTQMGIDSREKINEANITSREKMNAERIASKEKIAAMKKINAKAGVGGEGSALSKLNLTNQNKAALIAMRVMRQNLTFMNWQKLSGPGTDRLKLAKLNIEAEGPNASAQHVEAMMNFFGYIRGGVPAENETKAWQSMTSKISTLLDRAGAMVGFQNLGRDFAEGNVDADKMRKTWSGMAPEQRAGLARAINESIDFVRESAKKSLISTQMAFEKFGPEVKEVAVGSLDALANFIGMPKQRWFSDVRETKTTALPISWGEDGGEAKQEMTPEAALKILDNVLGKSK